MNYFKTIWNWIDIIPPFIQISIALLQMNGYYLNFNDSTEDGHENRRELAIMLSLASLCLWFKFLYFLRIFDGTGFLIRAILAVIVDMKYFLLILFIAMMAFGDSFKVMSMANIEGKEFIAGGLIESLFYTYLIGLGEFNLDDFGQVGKTYCTVLFLLNTILTTIIMLNLFIAIISESFDKINSQGAQASYREKAGLIAENSFLLSGEAKANWCIKDKFLLYVQVLGLNEGDDTVEFRQRIHIEEQTAKIEQKV